MSRNRHQSDSLHSAARHGTLAVLLLVLGLPLTATPAQADKVQIYKKADGTLLFTNRDARIVREPGMKLLETRVYGDDHYARKPRALTAKRRDAYDDLIRTAADRWDVDFPLIKAVMHAESAFDPEAVSRTGARGLMQLMPQTASMLQVSDIHDPRQNINAGTRYLRMMLDQFRGNVKNALAAYNAGPGNVQKYGGIPPFAETRSYVAKVQTLTEGYRELQLTAR